MNPLELLDMPRAAAYNLGRSAYRGLSGEGSVDDVVSALPGMLGLLGGVAAAPFTGGASIPIGTALAGAAQAGGRMMDDSRFEAATPSELLKALNIEDDPMGVTSFLTGMATDPMTYLGAAGAIKGGTKIANGLKAMDREAELARIGLSPSRSRAGWTAMPARDIRPELGGVRLDVPKGEMGDMRKWIDAKTWGPLVGPTDVNPTMEGVQSLFSKFGEPPPGKMAAIAEKYGHQPVPDSLGSMELFPGIHPESTIDLGGMGRPLPPMTPNRQLEEAARASVLSDLLRDTTDLPPVVGAMTRPSLGSPLLTSEALGAADKTLPGGYVLAMQKKPIRTFEGAPQSLFRRGQQVFPSIGAPQSPMIPRSDIL